MEFKIINKEDLSIIIEGYRNGYIAKCIENEIFVFGNTRNEAYDNIMDYINNYDPNKANQNEVAVEANNSKEYSCFNNILFMGNGTYSMAMQRLLHKRLDYALSISSGLQQDGAPSDSDKKEWEGKIKDVLEDISIALGAK